MSTQPSRTIQTEFDIPKFLEQRRLLDATTFDKAERNGVGKQLLKSLLNRFGSMRECVESQATLARVFSVQRGTINVAINRLTALDLITKERIWNHRYGRVLNHYRLNWTELARRLERHSSEPKQSDQCEDSPDTNVRIHGGPMSGSTPDQCQDSPDTNVRFHGDRNRRPNEIEIITTTTTTNDEWKPVVVVLEKIGVSQIAKATAKAKSITPFDEWYAIYPKHVARGSAVKAYRKAIGDIVKVDDVKTEQAAAMLLRWTQERLPSLNSTEMQFRPYPATWLNGERYRDEITTRTTADALAEYETFT